MVEPAELAPPLVPVVVEQQPVDMVRVEKSLHSLGFFASTASKEISRTVIQVIRRPDGQRIQAKAVIEGIPSLGLPTTADRDKYMADEEFVKIMFTELSNQDPLKPNDSNQMLQQLSSLRSIQSDIELSNKLESIVTQNQLAFAWGRRAAIDPDAVARALTPAQVVTLQRRESLDEKRAELKAFGPYP